MKRLQRDAVILSIVENLKAKGSWCGETHIQKAAYFIQELLGVSRVRKSVLSSNFSTVKVGR